MRWRALAVMSEIVQVVRLVHTGHRSPLGPTSRPLSAAQMMYALGLRLFAVLTLAGLTSACLVGPDYARPSAETPLAFTEAASSPVLTGRLWTGLIERIS